MQEEAKNKIYTQFYLYNHKKCLQYTKTSSYAKVQAYTKGCWHRYHLNLYKGQKYFIRDLQTIMTYDPQSADQVFKEYNGKIRYTYYDEDSDNDKNVTVINKVFVQCRRCGKYTLPWKFCPKCQDTHYCSETCEVNVKITHEKEQCRVKLYPKIHHGVLIQVHFGSRLGHNVEVYAQHEARSSALMRGKAILQNMFNNFVGLKNSSGMMGGDELRSSKTFHVFQDRLKGYNITLEPQLKCLQFAYKNDKDYPTGVLKVDVESMDDIRRVYEQNPVLDQIQLFLAREGGIMVDSPEEVHNNHVHYVYLFRMP